MKYAEPQIPISILILTRNESANIRGVLDSVYRFNDVVVLDSHSTDDTVDKAESLGARVVCREFDNWSAHQNWALKNIDFRNRWVFYLDADERMTDDLSTEIQKIAENTNIPKVGYFCGRDNYFMGRKISRCYPPVPILRFFVPEHVTYKRLVNPIAEVDGRTGVLKSKFLHYNFSKGLTEWVDKHNKYSTAEAQEAILSLKTNQYRLLDVLSSNTVQRRAALKTISWRLPFRPAVKFIYLYFICRGFLDGYPGLTYCLLQSVYEYLISLKILEQTYGSNGKQF